MRRLRGSGSNGTENQRKAGLEFGAAVSMGSFQNFDLANEFSAPLPSPFSGQEDASGRVRQNGGFIELSRQHAGLRAGTGLNAFSGPLLPKPLIG